MLGNALEVCAMLTATGYVISAKRLSATYPPLFITAVQSLAGFVFFLPVLALPGVTLPESLPLTPTLLLSISGCASRWAHMVCTTCGVSRLPAGQAASYINLIPVLTLIVDRVVLGDE